MSEQEHIKVVDQNLSTFLTKFQSIEDRLVLVCLPVVIFTLILWAIASAFPVTATVINFVISLLLLFATCIMILRLVEIAWRWGINSWGSSDDIGIGIYMMGVVGVIILIGSGVACLIDMLVHAGQAPSSRIILEVGLLLTLALQYRAIIYRHVVSKQSPDKPDNEKATRSEE